MKLWTSGRNAVLLSLGCLLFLLMAPQPGRAIPAFARKLNLKCYNCHTIPPALNKTGYMFKRLGYRMPPDNMDGSKPAPIVRTLDNNIPFRITNVLALITQSSFTNDKTISDVGNTTSASPVSMCTGGVNGSLQHSSCSSFNLDEAALFLASSVPDTGFSYFGHYELYQGGANDLEQGFGVYSVGRANHSFFVKGGKIHMQEGEGTRAAMFYNLFSDPSYTLVNGDPLGFSLDQGPVGVDVGYTWASNYFEKIFGISAKVTNGLNADGSEILDSSTKNSKDVWADADYWFGEDSGVTLMMYRGSKDQVQNAGAPDEFTYRPAIWREGVFGNHFMFDKLDLLGGYIHSEDEWQWSQGTGFNHYLANTARGEVDYYLRTGTALMARMDYGKARITPQPNMTERAWGVGAEHALTALGNVVARLSYNQEHDGDPLALTGTTDKNLRLDVRVMF